MLKPGTPAPDFSLASDGGTTISLRELKGKPVVLYFYPKDDTPGCTTEACDFRDNWQAVQGARAVVLGISPDSAGYHERFKQKYHLTLPLLGEENHQVAEAYGAWGEKSMYGRKYRGILRNTYLIDREGRIAQVFEKVKPKGHARQVLDALQSLKTGGK